MTAALLQNIYEGKTNLTDLSLEELRTLVVQYPYFNHLRILLAKKSHMQDDQKSNNDILFAAMSTHPRKSLYDFIFRKKKAFI